MYVAIFIAAVAFFIMFHEFGHFATAKLFGMKAEKFFLGFGPTLWSVRRGETEYGVKAIPAGGFVKIAGMNRFERVEPADRGRLFYEQSAWKRVIVLAAGSATHFLVATVLLFCALAFVGIPGVSNTVAQTTVDSPAREAGLRAGDRIVAVDGRATPDFEAVRDAVTPRGGDTVTLRVERAGALRDLRVTLADTDAQGQRQGFLGVAPQPVARTLPPAQALVETFTGEFSIVRLTSVSLGGVAQALSPQGLAEWFASVGDPGPRTSTEGPVSLVGAGQIVSALGTTGDVFAVLLLFANLNVVLGALNMAPLPPLDGGHVAVLLVEQAVNGVRRVRGRAADWQLNPSVLTPIALAVILFFGMVFVTALYVDLVKPASGLLQ